MNFLSTLRYVGPCGVNGKAYQIDYNSFVKARKNGDIVPYENNRKIDWNRVTDMASNFSPNHFTRIIAVEERVGGKQKVKQMSCHHRSLAVEELEKGSGLGTIGNCNLTVEIYPHDEAAALYVIEGNSVSLKIADLLKNKDFAFCHLLADSIRFADLSDYKGTAILKDTLLTNIAHMIYAMNQSNYSDLTFDKVIGSRHSIEVKRLVKLPDGSVSFDLKLTTNQRNKITQALNYSVEVVKKIIDTCDESSGNTKSAKLNRRGSVLMRQGRLVSYLVWNKIIGGAVTQIQADTLARALCEKDGQLITDAINALGARDWETFSSKIFDLARTKKGWSKGEK